MTTQAPDLAPAVAAPLPAADLFAVAQGFFDEFVKELQSYGLVVDPAMELRRGTGLLCYYDLEDGHIYVSLPDLNDPAGRLHLYMMSSLMGCQTEEETAQFFRIFIPHLIAHELAHHFRHQRGMFSTDPWHEEQVANKLAVAMCRQRLTPELMRFATRIVPAAIRSITEQLGSTTMALDSYRDLAQAMNVAGAVSGDGLAHVDLIRRLFANTETAELLTASARLPEAETTRLAGRAGLIAGINEDYKSGPDFVRYVYYHLGWSFIGLVGRESHYVEEFAHEHLGARPDFLPAVDDQAVVPAAAIQACYSAAQATISRSAAAAHYFDQRYRALLLAAISAGAGAAPVAALLDLSRNQPADSLDFLTAVASPQLAALLPGRIAAIETNAIGASLPAESDRRLWQLVKGCVSDAGAAATLQRLKMMLRIDALRGLPAAGQLEVARHLWQHRAAPGTIVARQGDVNDDVFFLLSGQLEAVTEIDGSASVTGSVRPGGMFGDETFFTRRPRQSSMRASEAAECLAIKGADLRLLAFDHPALLMAMAGVIRGCSLRPHTQ